MIMVDDFHMGEKCPLLCGSDPVCISILNAMPSMLCGHFLHPQVPLLPCQTCTHLPAGAQL